MLKFQRNKLVGVVHKGGGRLSVHGILEDDIFGLELDVEIALADRCIKAIRGRWKREETPECWRAVPMLQEALGLNIDDGDLGRRIDKTVGRHACPHFANLLLECCETAFQAAAGLKAASMPQEPEQAAREAGGHQDPGPVNVSPVPDGPPVKGRRAHETASQTTAEKTTRKGFLVDLHTHAFPSSACSSVDVDALVLRAKQIGLDAICLTDHHHNWPADALEALGRKHGFLVLGGNEITTDQGDMLVFGMHDDIQGIIGVNALRRRVDQAGGVMIAAHPFRGFLVFDTSQIGLTVENAADREMFRLVDAVETLNGNVTRQENAFAQKVALILGLPMTGGSDAHDESEVGKHVTCFEQPLHNEGDLVAALQSGAYRPLTLSKRGAFSHDR